MQSVFALTSLVNISNPGIASDFASLSKRIERPDKKEFDLDAFSLF